MQTLLAATVESVQPKVYAFSFTEGVPFTVKVQKARTRRGKQYYVLRVTIPKAVQHKLHVRPNDYLFLLAEQAKWYHLVDWTKMPETLQRLPDDLRKVLAASKLIPT